MFIGNITKDPEVRYLPNGDAVANASIACNENYKDKNGGKKESVEFVNLVFYKKLAEIVGEWCKKGQSIYVEGKMKTRKWQTKEGQDRYTTDIVVSEMKMLGGKPSGISEERGKSHPQREATNSSEDRNGFDDFDDNIPF